MASWRSSVPLPLSRPLWFSCAYTTGFLLWFADGDKSKVSLLDQPIPANFLSGQPLIFDELVNACHVNAEFLGGLVRCYQSHHATFYTRRKILCQARRFSLTNPLFCYRVYLSLDNTEKDTL